MERQQKLTGQEIEGKKEKHAADLMTYSGFLWSSLPRISLKRSMFEVSAYEIACLSAGGEGGVGGGARVQKERDRYTDHEEVR